MKVESAIGIIKSHGYNPIGFGILFGQDVILFSTRAETEEVKEKLSSELEGSQAECYEKGDFSAFAATDENSSWTFFKQPKSRINTIEELAALPTETKIVRILKGEEDRFKMVKNELRDDLAIIFNGNAHVVRSRDFQEARWFLAENVSTKELGFHIIEQLQKMKSDYISKIDSQIEAVRKFFV